MKSERNKLLALLGAAHSLNHSLFVIAPPLLTIIMNDLQVSKFVIGSVGTASSFIYGTGALVGGPIGDKIGEIKSITLCLAFAGLSSFLMFLAGNVLIYALSLVLMAAWASLYHPAANSLLSKVFHENTGEAMGFHGMGGTLGVMLTPTIVWFIGRYLGWQFAFILFGFLSLLLALILLKNTKGVFDSKHLYEVKFFEIFQIPELWRILIFNIAVGLFMKGIEYFFPLYLKESKQVDPMWASVAYTLVLASGVPGQWIGGKASDIFGSRKVLIATSAGVLLGLLSLQFLPFQFLAIPLFIALYGISFYGHQPALNSLTGAISPEKARGTAYGAFFFTSFGIGSVSQSLAGFLADNYGLKTAFHMLTLFATTALVLSLFLPKTDKMARKEA